jgi:hypothetical protein
VQAVAQAAPAAAPAAPATVKGKANRTGVAPSVPDVASPARKLTTKKEMDVEFSRMLREAINEENLGSTG